MEIQQIVLLCLFGAVLVLSATRLIHPSAIALAAALALVAWHGQGVLAGLRADVLLAAAGVMVLAGFVKRTGLVSWLALKAARNARGRPRGILLRTGLLAFFAGALFGPAAAALVLPVALLLTVELDIPVLPFIVTLSWCSLLGGLALPTAQPGNLWVTAALDLGGHWLPVMLPIAVTGLAVSLALAVLVFRRSLRVTNERRARVLEYDESKALENRPLAAKTVAVLVLVAIALALRPWIPLPPAVAILSGALLLTLISGRSALPAALAELDGAVLVWYGALLVIVGAVAVSGAWTVPAVPPLVLLWGSAVAGAVFDPGTVAGSLSALGGPGALWPLLVAGSAIGGGATLWAGRSAAVSAAIGGAKGPGWTRVILWSLLFAVVNLIAVSGLWLVSH